MVDDCINVWYHMQMRIPEEDLSTLRKTFKEIPSTKDAFEKYMAIKDPEYISVVEINDRVSPSIDLVTLVTKEILQTDGGSSLQAVICCITLS